MKRITLDRDDLEMLLNGQCTTVDGVHVSLEDIELETIVADVHRARNQPKHYRCRRCDLPTDNLRGAYAIDGMSVCHRCIEPDERGVALIARCDL